MKYLALGDSYTIGEQIAFSNNFPNQLLNYLVEKEKDNNILLKLIAKTGWTSDELIEAIKKDTFEEKYDYISLLIGVNNQYRNYAFSTFKNDFIYLLNFIEDLNKKPENVFIFSIPDWSKTPFAINNKQHPKPLKTSEEIKNYNTFIKEEANKRKFTFIDIYELSQKQGKENSAKYLTQDKLHYSKEAYLEWIELIKHKTL